MKVLYFFILIDILFLYFFLFFFRNLMEYSDLNDSEVEIELWDDPTEVSSDFIITGNSTCDGMLTTHDYHFKIQYSFM